MALSRSISHGASRRQPVDEREERGPGDAEAVACVATLAGAPAERRGFLGGVEQPLDRAGQRGDVPRPHPQAPAPPDLRGPRAAPPAARPRPPPPPPNPPRPP